VQLILLVMMKMENEKYGFWKFAKEFTGNHPFITGLLALVGGCSAIGSSCYMVDSVSRRVSGVEYKAPSDAQVCLQTVKVDYDRCKIEEPLRSVLRDNGAEDKCERLHTSGIEACMGNKYQGENKN
jgi:hypothetical protein